MVNLAHQDRCRHLLEHGLYSNGTNAFVLWRKFLASCPLVGIYMEFVLFVNKTK